MSAKDVGNDANQGIGRGYSHAYVLEELRAQYRRAQLATTIEGFNLVMHKTWDSRIALVSVPSEDALDAAAPQTNDAALGSFLLTGELLDILDAKTERGWLPVETLAQAAVAAGGGAVRGSFAADALNDINTSYYLSDVAFEPEAGLATMYTENRPINLAIGRMLASVGNSVGQAGQRPGKRRPRVKELCAGNNNAHWSLIAKSAVKGGAEHLDITLSDFFAPKIHKKARTRRSTLHAEACSLFDKPAALASGERFDAIISTYGFDSVWLQGDLHLSKIDGRWYQTLYRAKVADWHPRRTELVAALRHGKPLPHATAADYDGIVVEHILEPFDIRSHPYKTLLEKYPLRSFNVPGGLVQYVRDCFDFQLQQHGSFVSFDMGNFAFVDKSPPGEESGKPPAGTRILPPQAKSGVAARYQPGEYVLAKEILEKEHGLHVRLLGLQEFVAQYLGADWRKKATAVERHQIEHVSANGVMIVTT